MQFEKELHSLHSFNNQSIILNQRENKISSFVQKQVLNRTSTEHGILTKLGGSFFSSYKEM